MTDTVCFNNICASVQGISHIPQSTGHCLVCGIVYEVNQHKNIVSWPGLIKLPNILLN